MRISDWSSDVCSSDLPSDRQSTTCTAAGTPGVQSMPCDNSLADGRGATLRAFAGTLARGDRARVAAYVLVSLLAAFAGSLAALLLVPLIQPGTMPSFGGNLPGEPWSLGAQAAIFAAAMGIFALLRWSGACLGARLAAHCGMGLRSQVHARLIRRSEEHTSELQSLMRIS